MTDNVLASLTKRRAEMLTEVKQADEILDRLLTDPDHLDGAIRVYDPAYRPVKPILLRAEHASISRAALGVMRLSPEPMTVRQATLGVMGELGMDRKNHSMVATTMEKVRAVLLRQQKAGVVRTVEGDGQATLWEVTK